MATMCLHCIKNKCQKGRRLCQNCRINKEIRVLYPYTGKYQKKTIEETIVSESPLPAETTDARPGTREKIAIMSGRAARREALFHPDDKPRKFLVGTDECFLSYTHIEKRLKKLMKGWKRTNRPVHKVGLPSNIHGSFVEKMLDNFSFNLPGRYNG